MSNENKAELFSLLSLSDTIVNLVEELLEALGDHDDCAVHSMIVLALTMIPEEESPKPEVAYEDLLTNKGKKYLKAIKVAVEEE